MKYIDISSWFRYLFPANLVIQLKAPLIQRGHAADTFLAGIFTS